jgi:hypothetical protein
MQLDRVTADALSAMKQGGQQIADNAYWKWHNGAYQGCDAMRPEQEKHWKAVRERVAELASELRQRTKESQCNQQ